LPRSKSPNYSPFPTFQHHFKQKQSYFMATLMKLKTFTFGSLLVY